LRAFNAAAPNQGGETNESFKTSINAVSYHVFPQKALARQKRYMRRAMRKIADLKIRSYIARIVEMNDDLKYYPPHFEEMWKLDEDEISNIVEASLPNSWQRQLILQGFEITEHMLDELIEFCERLEVTEDLFQGVRTKGQKANASLKGSKSNGTEQVAKDKKSSEGGTDKKRKTNGKWCAYHNSNRHDFSECKVMLDQAKKMRSTLGPKKGTSSTFRSKTQTSREADDLNVMISKLIDEKLKTTSSKKANFHKRKAQVKDEDLELDLETKLSLSEPEMQSDSESE
jgi:hypothetical protein